MPPETLDEKVERMISLFYDLRTEMRSESSKVEQQFIAVNNNISRIENEFLRFGSDISEKFEEVDKTKWNPVQWAIIGVGGIAVTVLGGILALVFNAG